MNLYICVYNFHIYTYIFDRINMEIDKSKIKSKDFKLPVLINGSITIKKILKQSYQTWHNRQRALFLIIIGLILLLNTHKIFTKKFNMFGHETIPKKFQNIQVNQDTYQ